MSKSFSYNNTKKLVANHDVIPNRQLPGQQGRVVQPKVRSSLEPITPLQRSRMARLDIGVMRSLNLQAKQAIAAESIDDEPIADAEAIQPRVKLHGSQRQESLTLSNQVLTSQVQPLASTGALLIQRVKVTVGKKKLDLTKDDDWNKFVDYVVTEGNKTVLTAFFTDLITEINKERTIVGTNEYDAQKKAVKLVNKAKELRENGAYTNEAYTKEQLMGRETVQSQEDRGFTPVTEAPSQYQTMRQVLDAMGMQSGGNKWDPQSRQYKACYVKESMGTVKRQQGPDVYLHMTFFLPSQQENRPVKRNNISLLFAGIHITAELNTGDEQVNPRYYFMRQSNRGTGRGDLLTPEAQQTIIALGNQERANLQQAAEL